jgi:hypothetical protein
MQPYYYTIIDETRKLGDIVMKDVNGKDRVERFVAGLYQIIKSIVESVWKSERTAKNSTDEFFANDNHLVCLQALGENAVRFYSQFRQPNWTAKDGISFFLKVLPDIFIHKCQLNRYRDVL